jgi:transposase
MIAFAATERRTRRRGRLRDATRFSRLGARDGRLLSPDDAQADRARLTSDAGLLLS